MFFPWTGSATSSGLYHNFLTNIAGVEAAIEKGKSAPNTRTIVLIADSRESAKMFEIVYDADKGKCSHKIVKQYKALEMTGKGLQEYIGEMKRYSPTPLYAMIMGAHGSGWIPKTEKEKRSRSIGGLTYTEQLNISEIAYAISSNGIKMQFICFDDCYMSNIELAYELKDAANYLIASTSEIMEEGLPYQDVFQYMAAQTPDYKAITDGFLGYYTIAKYPYGSLSVIDCAYATSMAQVLRQMNTSGITAPEASTLSAQDGETACRFYDLGNYLREYNHNLRMADRDTVEYRSVMERLIPSAVKTPHLFTVYRGWDGSVYDVSAYSGITISDPSTAPKVIRSKSETSWWKATH
ncbi:clostripain-related cysteine peptidase [Prevotella dentasini]|uniref:clostripain-related cysteine peptidase n=1 Tax=Prevotella dentasini TaxID=589537 RepID=UPI00131F2344|nr:clostripain-related cysteine peptidase [Prevotella dentasini]